MMNLLSGWKLTALAFAAGLALMAVPLVLQTMRLGDARERLAARTAEIEHPETGFIARLNTCRMSNATLEASLKAQNQAVEDLKAASDAAILRAEARARQARIDAAVALKRAQTTLDRPIEGETVLERVLDVDRVFLEGLEQ